MIAASEKIYRCLRLACAAVIVAAIWIVILPRMQAIPSVSEHMQRMTDRDVNAGAMYYTELEHLPLRPDWVAERIALWPEWLMKSRESRLFEERER